MGGSCQGRPYSSHPIRYFNGEVQLAATDLSAGGFGTPWEQKRVYSNQLSSNADVGNGYNWLVEDWPYLVQEPDGSIHFIRGTKRSLQFDFDSGVYTGRFGAKSTLTHNLSTGQFTLAQPNGEQWIFHDFDQFNFPPGMFASHVSPGGQVINATGYTIDNRIEAEQRSFTIDDVTTTESFAYEYDANGRVESATLRRQVDSDPWLNIRRVEYTYYTSSDPNGSEGDLRSATRLQWNGSAWESIGISYYRYWLSSSSTGFQHGLKYVLDETSFARMEADELDPFTATDGEIMLYADNYFEYDGQRRVTKEIVFGGSQTFEFTYTPSSHADDYNHWAMKTVETLPDESQVTVYTNYIGQVILKELSSDGDHWMEYHQYDEDGHEVLMAEPSAILGYNDTAADLDVSLRPNDGLIHLTKYYPAENGSSSSRSGSGPAGYKKAEMLQEGSSGDPILQKTWEYAPHTVAGQTIYPKSAETVYRNDDGSGAITTSFDYTWHSGTQQIAQMTTTLPVVPTNQNGSGVAATRRDYFDEFGNRTWGMDERGYVTRLKYDIPTGALTQRINDVDTSIETDAPSGWVTPSDGGWNLITAYEHDEIGRTTQTLGPWHTIDIDGTATEIRRASWIVYDENPEREIVRTGQGYATGTAPSYTYTLINPVSIAIFAKNGKPLEQIQATRAGASGKLLPSDTFTQASYTRWTTFQYTDCCNLASQRVYHTIPTSGAGSPGTNYDETNYGYDVMKRRNRQVTPGGTITRTVFDSRGLTLSTWVGTDDTGATTTDPSGGGAAGNNMVVITELEYDGGSDGGDGNLTQTTQWVDATTGRVTDGGYDWRNRLVWVDGELDYFATATYDNLDQMTRVDRYDTTSTGNLIARRETEFDDLGRIYQSVRFGVDPSTGNLGNSLVDNTWYDPADNTVKTLVAGSDLWTKTTFDSLGRELAIYVGYGADASYGDIFSVTGNVVLSQTGIVYDDGGNPIQRIQRERYHNAPASQTGALGWPSVTPNARATYIANYPDPLGRAQANANYGTNGGAAFFRSSTIPARSDGTLVQSQTYDEAGNLWDSIDAAGVITRFGYDDAGRRKEVVENYQPGSSSSSYSSSSGTDCRPSHDVNITTNLTYTPDGFVESLESINPSTGNQLTNYVYGTTLADSAVAASILLRSVIYPDSSGSSDQVWIGYNRQAQRASLTDQNGTSHLYDYDLLGRLTQDRVGALGTNVDGAIRRIEMAYDVRGLMSLITSSDSQHVGSGSTVNEVRFTYNDFGQSTNTYQAHAGAVDLMTTPSVQMDYANGSENTVRPISLTYPSGRQLTYNYGMIGSIDSSASRVTSLIDSDGGSTHLADYSYLGLGSVVQQTSAQADLRFTLANIASGNDPDTGDIYTGLDRFGRIKDVRWRNTNSNTDLSRIQYGYDRASNRTWRENPTDPNRNFDWKYGYDGNHRLKNGQRGTLNGTQTAITNPQFGQCWTLDETGNWERFKQANSGAAWTLEQARTSNEVNEITEIDNSVGDLWTEPVYDNAGNMTTVPKPADPTDSFMATYDAWNRLVKLTDGNEGPVAQENEYDGRGYRIITKSYDETEAILETRQAYFTDGWQVVEERLGESATPERQFVWGVRYIDDLVLRDRSVDSGALNERLYSLQDGNWNVTAVADATGTVQERYEYDPYGVASVLAPNFTIRGVSDFEWETTYCGYRWDAGSELFAVRFRYYHSVLGSWLTRDPIGYAAGDANLVRYVTSAPVSWGDPLGNAKIKAGGQIFYVHQTDHPPFHAHVGSDASTVKVNMETGEILRKNKGTGKFLDKKTFKELRRRLGLAGLCASFVFMVPEALQAAESGGGAGVAQYAHDQAHDAAITASTSLAAGLAIHGTTVATGTTLTTTSTATALGGGAAITGLGSATAVGGAAVGSFAGGYVIGDAIAHTPVGGNTVSGHLGEAGYATYSTGHSIGTSIAQTQVGNNSISNHLGNAMYYVFPWYFNE